MDEQPDFERIIPQNVLGASNREHSSIARLATKPALLVCRAYPLSGPCGPTTLPSVRKLRLIHPHSEDETLQIGHINLARGFAGGEQQTLNLLRELAAQGVRQELICRAPGRLSEKALELGIEVHYVSHWLSGHHSRYAADLWHAHDGKAVYWAALQRKLHPTPYLITRRVEHPVKSNPLARAAYRNASYVACLSRAIDNRISELDSSTKRVVIPSSFSTFNSDHEQAAAIRAQYPGKFLVGQVGSLIPIKGQHITLEAARQLADKLPSLQFLLLGDGPERDTLAAASKDLPNLSLLGHQRNIGPYFEAFDLFILPSLMEGLGSSILEAMQAGTPVLASSAGGIPDVVEHQVTGWLVSPGNPDELAEAIEYLYHHPSLRQQITQKARAGLERFSPTKIAESYLRLYRTITGSHR